MKTRRTFKYSLAMFAFLVFAMQSTAIAHAAQYGDAPHEHNGVVCVLDAIAVTTNIVLPTPIFVPVAPEKPKVFYFVEEKTASYITPPGRAPPPRSPPLPLF